MTNKIRKVKSNRYLAIIEKIFLDHWKEGIREFYFERQEINEAAKALNITLPKNIGDVIYSLRYRINNPKVVQDATPEGLQWEILGAGRSKYKFVLNKKFELTPNVNLITIKIPDATPEIISSNAQGDEQALLAKIRYNRLVDIFLGITAYSLQNHLRTSVRGVGQLEIDEVYVGLDKSGRQYVIPVQAKGGADHLGIAQTKQDLACCRYKFPNLICRTVSVQFLNDVTVVMFEITEDSNGDLRILDEKHYQLVKAHEITPEDINVYKKINNQMND